MTHLNAEQYVAAKKAFLEEQGPNQGFGMFGHMAWVLIKEREFHAKLKESGTTWEVPEGPKSSAYPATTHKAWG